MRSFALTVEPAMRTYADTANDTNRPALPLAWDAARTIAAGGSRFLTASVAAEIGILIALSVLFPFLIHILPVPDKAGLGARLLPMFYAPLLGALLGRTRSAFAVALAAPWCNWLLTSFPIPPIATLMTVQLVVFVATIRVLLSRLGARWYLAAPAYVAALAAAALVAAIFPVLIGHRPALAWAGHTFTSGLPGLALLLLINGLAVRAYPSGPGGGPMTA